MKNTRFHGITSLLLVALASLLGLATMFLQNRLWAFIFLASLPLLGYIILASFCARCPCKAHCGHVLPGKIAAHFPRKPGVYRISELLGVSLSILLLLGLPQYWLWQTPSLAIVYWILLSIALSQIRLAVCPACHNTFCPLCLKSYLNQKEEIK